MLLGVVVVCGLVLGALAGRRLGRAALTAWLERVRADATARRRDAEQAGIEAAEMIRRGAELAAKEQLLAERSTLERELAAEGERVARLREGVMRSETAVVARETALRERKAAYDKLENDIKSREGQARASKRDLEKLAGEAVTVLERVAGEPREAIRDRMVEALVEDERAAAAAQLRAIDQNAADPEHAREAKRIMSMAMQRYDGHFLTERLVSTMPLPPPLLEKMAGPEGRNFAAIEVETGIKLLVSDARDAIRLEGQDGIGREVVRRVIRRYEKEPRLVEKDPQPLVHSIKERLDREVVEFGRKAFAELKIPRAHPEIVELVGRLNWRTSYTQNQWKHAIEAAILCGMIADEIGLDTKIARRAALMHDIGKSLTHAIDGSHAVIGADIARRLGEDEVVANAIGAHHLDEPFNSVYAEIVAACDAISGARPGARRESAMVEAYGKRLIELERIAASLRGVDSVHPVQGGREVRVYVQENRVSDERCVEMSAELARRISEEMVFPGQIKVTVIREFRAVEVAS